MPKKKQNTNYTPDMQNNKGIITVSFNRLAALLAGAVIAGLVGGIFTGYSITRNTAFIANSNAVAIAELDNIYVRKDVVAVWIESIDKRLGNIEGKLGVK